MAAYIKVQVSVRCNHKGCTRRTSVTVPLDCLSLKLDSAALIKAKGWEMVEWHGEWYAFCDLHKNA